MSNIPVIKIEEMIPIQYGKHEVCDVNVFPCITARYYKGILNNQEEAAVGILIGRPREDIEIFALDKSEGGGARENDC